MAYSSSDPKVAAQIGPVGLIYGNDEVMVAAMKGAGEIFKYQHCAPAPHPTTFIFGKRSLYDPSTMDYGVAYGMLGDRVMPTMYRYGLNMYVDTTRETDTVIGPSFANRIFEPLPYRPTPQIEYDWQKGYLKMDAPGAAAYAGFFAQYGGPVRFANGLTLDKVTVRNPPEIAYPVGKDELYICFSAAALDGKPLNASKDVSITLVSTSFNKGFKLDHRKFKGEFLWQANPGAIVIGGTGPVQVARAGATVHAKALDGMSYTMLDWNMKPIGTGTVSQGILVVPDTKPVFAIRLVRK
jgi:hypothetical protein